MANQASSTKSTVVTKPKKEPATPAQRITDALKRAAVQGKISKDELASIVSLAGALQTFMAS